MAPLIELCLYYEHRHEGETWAEIDAQIEACRQRNRAEGGLGAAADVPMPVYEAAPKRQDPEPCC